MLLISYLCMHSLIEIHKNCSRNTFVFDEVSRNLFYRSMIQNRITYFIECLMILVCRSNKKSPFQAQFGWLCTFFLFIALYRNIKSVQYISKRNTWKIVLSVLMNSGDNQMINDADSISCTIFHTGICIIVTWNPQYCI